MSTFNLLSEKIQKKVWGMKWDAFTPIQDMAIPAIIKTKNDVVLSSGTASGKTEAAFLPILSMVEKEAESKLKVIYISPLKALINNQFMRIESLCEYTDIPIHRWHGDVSQSKKKKFLKAPAGILQITPESIESLFVNRTEQLQMVFQDVDFVVIDEIHSFLDSERGVHLRSLLSRMKTHTVNRPRIIGLSATIDNFELVKKWVNPDHPEHVEVIESPGSDKSLLYSLMHFRANEARQIPLELFEDMRELTRTQKALIFCNSRGVVEESTVLLNRLALKEKVGETYYAHHSSIDKKEREFVEKTMSESTSPKSVVATSSLELGIDVGNIDLVVQLDSTYTVSALKQRLGRSGRKQDSSQMLQLYSTSEDSLLQSLAVMELVRDKWVEPARGYSIPYDILFHQIISICKETNGLQKEKLLEEIQKNEIFYPLEDSKIQSVIENMLEREELEEIQGSQELIVGLEAERLLRGKDFYAVFMTSEEYEVIAGMKRIGKLDKIMFLNVDDNVILAGKLWTIQEIDSDRNKVYVKKAADGKPPKYTSGGIKIHKRIGEKMMEILCSDEVFTYVNEEARDTLEEIRRPYRHTGINKNQRVIWKNKEDMLFETFTGTTITQTLVWMFRCFGIQTKAPDGLGRIKLPGYVDIQELFSEVRNKAWNPNEILGQTKETELFLSKYKPNLPETLQEEMHVAHEVDIEGALKYLNEFEFVTISLTE
ncbi:DEAD/DEAH box helicase [Planococcus sp. N028]|uniref:DEAD/DEAH box helicase n=1 Tax=Planococcus shixiaomingii TaxID=3058393 RepID=A0ABT8N4P4_9BACL|nr:DEAD/DEAH box helicase [Planococcus sp. N028]MDN7242859.1 DEAD/DEAH box helicase [Planococcus sp. N028]